MFFLPIPDPNLWTRVRDSIATVQASHPALKAGMTGLPAMVQEEMAAVRGDTIRTTLFALVGITLLSLLAFHRRRLAPLVMVTLLMGAALREPRLHG